MPDPNRPPMTDAERERLYQEQRQREIDNRNRQIEEERQRTQAWQDDQRRTDQRLAEEQRQRTAVNAQFSAREKNQQTLNQQMAQMNAIADDGIMAEARRDIKKKRLNAFERQTPDYINAGVMTTVRHYLSVLGAIAVICLNYFLINAPVSFLAGLAFDDPNAWQAKAATLLVPVILLIFELGISIARRHAQQERDWASFKRWQVIGLVMIAVTPLLIFGTMLANPEWNATYQLVLSLGMLVLAGVTDAMIIFGGEQIYVAITYVWFNLTHWYLQSQIDDYQARLRKAERDILRIYIRFGQIFQGYNNRNPQHTLQAGLFLRRTAQFINRAAEQTVIQMPEIDPQDLPESQVYPNHPNPVPPDNPPQAAPVAPEPAPPTAAMDDEYYQTMLNNQARRNDRELTPD